jgi:hypothetical protein
MSAIQANTPMTADGKFFITHTGTLVPVDGPFDYGHMPGHEFRTAAAEAQSANLTREEFIESQNKPEIYRIEDPSENRSHRYEAPGC